MKTPGGKKMEKKLSGLLLLLLLYIKLGFFSSFFSVDSVPFHYLTL